MTIRDKIQVARRKAGIAAMIGWLVCLLGMPLTLFGSQVFLLVSIPGVLVCAAGVLYILFGIRCPQCRGPLGYAISYPPKGFFSISERIRFCQFCGVELDSELPEEQDPTGHRK